MRPIVVARARFATGGARDLARRRGEYHVWSVRPCYACGDTRYGLEGNMTLSINIPPDLEERLRAQAARLGIAEEECAAQILAEHLRSVPARGTSLSELFAE